MPREPKKHIEESGVARAVPRGFLEWRASNSGCPRQNRMIGYDMGADLNSYLERERASKRFRRYCRERRSKNRPLDFPFAHSRRPGCTMPYGTNQRFLATAKCTSARL